MSLETFVALICLIPAAIYFLVYEINWKYVREVIRKWTTS
jgi:hypothetical protein